MSKINVYGTGICALKWVIDNSNLRINSFLETKKSKDTFLGVDVIVAKDNENVLKKFYTVVATSVDSYWEIKSYLETEFGLVEFEDFEYMTTYNKKIAIIYGNCHARSVKSFLTQIPEFNKLYGCYPLNPICEIDKEINFSTKAFEKCSLFIHQSIRCNNAYGPEFASENLLKRLSSECKIISIPNLYQLPMFLFPQVDMHESETVHENLVLFSKKDKFIDAVCKEKSIEDIEKMINDEFLISHEEIRIAYMDFIDKVRTREKEWDVKIADFLVENMTKMQLFYDPGHPTPVVIRYVVGKILEKLNLIFDVSKIHGEVMAWGEIPVYKSVVKALNLEWEQEYLRFYDGSKLNNNAMDLNEYIRQYIHWNAYSIRND